MNLDLNLESRIILILIQHLGNIFPLIKFQNDVNFPDFDAIIKILFAVLILSPVLLGLMSY